MSSNHQGSSRQSLEAKLKTCLLRLAAVTIDLALWLFLAIFVLTPGCTAAAVLIVFGYLENFSFLFIPIVSIEIAYLTVAIIFLISLITYYPCRFESSNWQGTLGKVVLSLKCSDDVGERISFSRVAWRLILQAIIVCMLLAIVSLTTSPQFGDLVTSVTTAHSSRGLARTFRWSARIIPVILIAPYLMALFTQKNQTLIDLMVRRTVTRDQARSKSSPNLLAREFFQILFPNHTPARRRKNKIRIRIASVFVTVWVFSLALSLSAFLALPVSMFQVDQLFKAQDQSILEQHKRNTLFKHLDLVYKMLASNTQETNDFRRQCLSKAIMLDPHKHAYWYWRAQNYLAEERYTDALADASEAIRTYDSYHAAARDQSSLAPVLLKVVANENEEGALYSLRATIEQKLGDKQAAFEDLTKAISAAGRADDYKTWLELHEFIKEKKEADAKIRLARVTAIANEAYKILLKSPARFQEKKDLYNQMIDLNNAGVAALVQSKFDAAIEKFDSAIKVGAKLQNDRIVPQDSFEIAFKKWQKSLDLESRYGLAWRNLSIAYNGKAKTINDPEIALTYFHRALYFDSLNEPAQFNTAEAIQKLGLDPASFVDHIKLAERAAAKNDLEGAIVEYSLALKIRKDSEVERKLAILKSKVREPGLRNNSQ